MVNEGEKPMATVLKTMLVLIFAWIASVWPSAWTALLMMVALSAMCIGMAMERYFAGRAMDARKPSAQA
jgi:fatty-acid desaturase